MNAPEDPSSSRLPQPGMEVVPVSTGSAGDQTEGAVSDVIVVGQVPHDSDHVGAILGEHIQSGSPTTMAFAVAAFRDARTSRELLSRQLDRTADDRDRMRDQYHEESTKAAVLEAKLEIGSQFRRFQSWAFGIGGIVAGAGIGTAAQFGRARFLDVVLIVAGMAMMWLGAPLSSRVSS